MRKEIVTEVVASVRAAAQPVPLEALADRAVRALGHEKTVGSGWGGAGGFRDLLQKELPGDIRLTDQPPYYAFEVTRQIAREIEARPELRDRRPEPRVEPRVQTPHRRPQPLCRRAIPSARSRGPIRVLRCRNPGSSRAGTSKAIRLSSVPTSGQHQHRAMIGSSLRLTPISEWLNTAAAPQPQSGRIAARETRTECRTGDGASGLRRCHIAPGKLRRWAVWRACDASSVADFHIRGTAAFSGRAASGRAGSQNLPARSVESATQLQQSIARIHEACQVPPLSPPEYRVLFEVMAEEINANNLSGAQTLINIGQRARDMGLDVRRDDIRFVLEVASEPDPWFEQGASANLFASRFRNFVVARCRTQGLSLSADEIDLIDAWFGGTPTAQPRQAAPLPSYQQQPPSGGYAAQTSSAPGGSSRPNAPLDHRAVDASQKATGAFAADPDDEFPRIVRSRLRG